jgi:hypothetical protein
MGKRGHDWIQRNLVSQELAGKFDRIISSAIARSGDRAIARQQQEATA